MTQRVRAVIVAVIVTAGPLSLGGQTVVTQKWTAVLATRDAPTVAAGRATVTTLPNGDTTAHGTLTVKHGLEPGRAYTWHIAKGLCWSEAAKAEPVSETAPLTVDPQGRGTAEADFQLAERNLSSYHLDVHPVGSDVVLCGDLVPTQSR